MTDDTQANPWRTLSTRSIYTNPWIELQHNEVLTPAGSPGIYGVVRFRNHAVGVLPVSANGDTWLVGQYRYALDRYSWEIPEGGCPLGTAPADTALRELREETGLIAANLMPIQAVDMSNSVCDEQGTLFIAWNLAEGEAMPEETEQLHVRRLPLRAALDMALTGQITDSLSLIALLRLPILAAQPDLPADLRAALDQGLGLSGRAIG
ncbi:NUDIX domain-containing protein [Niveispirillum irakense]|uniref:NUDIX domain-containing protein n=1 Tax=Niveispirillum irakense TaxID=34011 RepID=UPI000416DE97|nr:NUDIX hydrolase [Niveispirillum irakense]